MENKNYIFSIGSLMCGKLENGLGYINKLGITLNEGNILVKEINDKFNESSFNDFKQYSKNIMEQIDNNFFELDSEIYKLYKNTQPIHDDKAIICGYIYKIYRIIYKEHVWCSNITDEMPEMNKLKKIGNHSIHNYRAHCKIILDSLKKLFLNYYTGSIDNTNYLVFNESIFSEEKIKKNVNLNLLLIKYAHTLILIEMQKCVINKKSLNLKLRLMDNIYATPYLYNNWLNYENQKSNGIKNLNYLFIKQDFINNWLGEKYYDVIDNSFIEDYNFSYSKFHRNIPYILITILLTLKNTNPSFTEDIFNKEYKKSCYILNKKDFFDFFKDIFSNDNLKTKEIKEENIKEMVRFLNDNVVKVKDLQNKKSNSNNKLCFSFLETDDKEYVLIIPEFFYETFLSNILMLDFLDDKKRQLITTKLGKLFEEKFNYYTTKEYKTNKETKETLIVKNSQLEFINNNPNIKLKKIFNLEGQDSLEVDTFFYHTESNCVYVIELKNNIRKRNIWQDIDIGALFNKKNGWKEKLEKRVKTVKKNLLKLKKHFSDISCNTKIKGILVVTKPVNSINCFWVDDENNEYFLCSPSAVEYVVRDNKIFDDIFENNVG